MVLIVRPTEQDATGVTDAGPQITRLEYGYFPAGSVWRYATIFATSASVSGGFTFLR